MNIWPYPCQNNSHGGRNDTNTLTLDGLERLSWAPTRCPGTDNINLSDTPNLRRGVSASRDLSSTVSSNVVLKGLHIYVQEYTQIICGVWYFQHVTAPPCQGTVIFRYFGAMNIVYYGHACHQNADYWCMCEKNSHRKCTIVETHNSHCQFPSILPLLSGMLIPVESCKINETPHNIVQYLIHIPYEWVF